MKNTTITSSTSINRHSIIHHNNSDIYVNSFDFGNIYMSCDEHIYELINAYTLYNEFNKAGFEVQLKYVIKNVERIIHSILLREIAHYDIIEIYHIIKDFNIEKLLYLFANNIKILHLEGSSINNTEVEDYLEDSKKELNKIIKVRLIKNGI